MLVTRYFPRRRWAITATLALASFALGEAGLSFNPELSFYSFPARAWELLRAGAWRSRRLNFRSIISVNSMHFMSAAISEENSIWPVQLTAVSEARPSGD
jgi:hypothetical protein